MGWEREPRDWEAHLFDEIYIDETSQTDHRFLLIGGLVFPRKYSALFEQTIREARLPEIPSIWPDGSAREIGWKKVSKGQLNAYFRVVDAFHSFKKHLTVSEDIRFHCSVVDTTIRGRKYSGRGRGQIGFNREVYFHLNRLGRERHNRLFHVYPDERSTDMTMKHMAYVLNRGIMKGGDKRDWPYRRIKFRRSHDVQAIQIADLFLGAIAYRLNGHYDQPNAPEYKKVLCDYICKRGYVLNLLNRRIVKSKVWGNFRIWVRKHS